MFPLNSDMIVTIQIPRSVETLVVIQPDKGTKGWNRSHGTHLRSGFLFDAWLCIVMTIIVSEI